jgi:HSP20 family protein
MNLFDKSSRNLPAKQRWGDYDVFKQFDDFFSRRGDDFYDVGFTTFSPVVNIDESEDAYHLEAELPGVDKDDIEINVKDDYLVIKGEKNSFNEEKRDKYHRVERSHGSFYRTIALPGDIDKESINAELKNGVLSVEIKKAINRESSEKKITIH